MAYFAILHIFLYHRTSPEKKINFLFKKQILDMLITSLRSSISLDHYLGHNSILNFRFNFRFLKKALYFRIITLLLGGTCLTQCLYYQSMLKMNIALMAVLI